MRSTRMQWNNWDLKYASRTSEDDLGTLRHFCWVEEPKRENAHFPSPISIVLETLGSSRQHTAFSGLVPSAEHPTHTRHFIIVV